MFLVLGKVTELRMVDNVILVLYHILATFHKFRENKYNMCICINSYENEEVIIVQFINNNFVYKTFKTTILLQNRLIASNRK